MRPRRFTFLAIMGIMFCVTGCTTDQQPANVALIRAAEVRIGDSFKPRSWRSSVDFVRGIAQTTRDEPGREAWWDLRLAVRKANCQRCLKILETYQSQHKNDHVFAPVLKDLHGTLQGLQYLEMFPSPTFRWAMHIENIYGSQTLLDLQTPSAKVLSDAECHAIAWSSNDDFVALVRDKSIAVFETRTAKRVSTIDCGSRICAAVFTSDARAMVVVLAHAHLSSLPLTFLAHAPPVSDYGIKAYDLTSDTTSREVMILNSERLWAEEFELVLN